MFPATSFEAFQAAAAAAGYTEVLPREWLPEQLVPEHSHPFDVQARVVRGEFWLQCAGQTRHVGAGEGFELAAGELHSERYGPVGATFWVARRYPA